MSVAVAEKVVCVTGGAGYIASWLVKLLLLRGYTVKATLRNPGFYHSLTFHVYKLLFMKMQWVIGYVVQEESMGMDIHIE